MKEVQFDRCKQDRGLVRHTVEDYLADAIARMRRGLVPEYLGGTNIIRMEPHWRSPSHGDFLHMESDIRRELTSSGMWAAVDLTWTKALASWIGDRTVLEVMAGRGWLAQALDHHGVSVCATDDCSWEETHWRADNAFSITKLDAVEAVKSCEADVLVISWPPHGSDEILHVMNEWGTARPVVYIGECSGCNAPDEFFDNFEELSDPKFHLPSYTWIYDTVLVGQWMSLMDVEKEITKREQRETFQTDGHWNWEHDRPDREHLSAIWIEEGEGDE